MSIFYDPDSGTLTVTLGPETDKSFEYESGDFTAFVDDADNLVKITIANVNGFIARALAVGVKVEGAPNVPPAQRGMVWHDADSSMISAFGYDEAEEILEVAFHNTGVYRYFDVPLYVFEELQEASSKGRYMRANIIDVYHYEKKRGRRRR